MKRLGILMAVALASFGSTTTSTEQASIRSLASPSTAPQAVEQTIDQRTPVTNQPGVDGESIAASPESVTGYKIGDTVHEAELNTPIPWNDSSGLPIPDKMPKWIAAGTADGVVVGYIKTDLNYLSLPPTEAAKMPNPENIIWDASGIKAIGCMTGSGPVMKLGEAITCD